VNLQEALEIQVGNLVLVSHTQKLGQLGVGQNAALERGVKAVVGLHVSGDKLGHISLALLALGGETHERTQLIAEGAQLEKCILRALQLPSSTLLRVEGCGVYLTTTLGLTGLALHGLGDLSKLVGGCAEAGS